MLIRSPRDVDTWLFSRNLALRLPGGWIPSWRDTSTSAGRSALMDRLWDTGAAQWALMEFVNDRVTQLRHYAGLDLVVIPRPLRPHQYLVGALVPVGHGYASNVDHLDPLPIAISVPNDPARAAEAVRRRLLPVYQQALRTVFHPGGWSVLDMGSARATSATSLGVHDSVPVPAKAPVRSAAADLAPGSVSPRRTR